MRHLELPRIETPGADVHPALEELQPIVRTASGFRLDDWDLDLRGSRPVQVQRSPVVFSRNPFVQESLIAVRRRRPRWRHHRSAPHSISIEIVGKERRGERSALLLGEVLVVEDPEATDTISRNPLAHRDRLFVELVDLRPRVRDPEPILESKRVRVVLLRPRRRVVSIEQTHRCSGAGVEALVRRNRSDVVDHLDPVVRDASDVRLEAVHLEVGLRVPGDVVGTLRAENHQNVADLDESADRLSVQSLKEAVVGVLVVPLDRGEVDPLRMGCISRRPLPAVIDRVVQNARESSQAILFLGLVLDRFGDRVRRGSDRPSR